MIQVPYASTVDVFSHVLNEKHLVLGFLSGRKLRIGHQFMKEQPLELKRLTCQERLQE